MDAELERVLLGIVVVVAVAVAAVAVLTPVVSTWIASRSWVPWSVHWDALGELWRHLDEPRGAYPPQWQPQIAGRRVWLGTAIGVLCFLTAVSAVIVARRAAARRPRGGWARRADTRPLRQAARRGSIVLGSCGRDRIAVEERHSLLVVGATQTHKSTGLAVPAILEADESAAIVISVKDDLVSDTIAWRSRLDGTHWVFDPVNTMGSITTDDLGELGGDELRRAQLRSKVVKAGWTPLSTSGTWQGALSTAFDLTRAGSSADGAADGDNKFFYESAESLIACYLYAAANSGGTMRTVLQWIASHTNEHVEAILEELPSIDALAFFRGVWKDDRKTLSNIFSTARLLVSAYLDPAVAASAERDDITTEGFFNGQRNTLYLVAPAANQDRLRVVFNMVVKQFVDAAYARVMATGRPLDTPLLIVIDELANIAPIPNLGQIASTAASQGIQLVSIVQDLAQLHTRYGANDANTIINNHRALLLLTGVKDPTTLEHASKLLGNIDDTHTSTSRDPVGPTVLADRVVTQHSPRPARPAPPTTSRTRHLDLRQLARHPTSSAAVVHKPPARRKGPISARQRRRSQPAAGPAASHR